MDRLGQYLSDMPGQKLMLSKGQSKMVWNILSDDTNWLCNRYSLREYEFVDEDIQRGIDVWSKPTLAYLENIFPEIPRRFKKMIVFEFLKKIISIRETLSLPKRRELFLFVLSVSKKVLLLKINTMITSRTNLSRRLFKILCQVKNS